MDLKRLLAGGIVVLTGLGVVAPNAATFTVDGIYEFAATALGIVLGLAIVGAAVVLYQSDVSTAHALRVAGWNTLGVVVLGLVILLAMEYPGVSLPTPIAASILGVSAVAHILIGFNDVRRIRASELAREREKLAVLNRLARHNLRNQAQVLTSAGELVAGHAADETGRDAAERVQTAAARIATINTKLKRFQEATERDDSRSEFDVATIVDSAVAPYRESYPDADITVDVPDDLAIEASQDLETALDELLENAFDHGNAAESGVRISATADGATVALTVADDGPGIPDHEWEAVSGETTQTQLEHASGLGLWVVKAVIESVDGEFRREDGTGGVTLSVPRA
ncbi:sensor histidine kinase [Salinibaculum rarum]|uniref:sensor histidine kinase n=1 Tax=Salinibaculum rarum TaxID=3058903 RepID=UPI00265FAAA2|nr:ATP-binding protein [Salinibaculum sp. KK48]